MKKSILFIALAATTSLVSCKKEGCTDPTAINYSEDAKKDDGSCEYEEFGSTTVSLSHVWGMSQAPFALNTELIHPMTNDTLTYSLFKYYISNFKLKKSDGTWWTHPESYFLVDLSDPSSTNLSLSNIPAGDYTEISYIMGVDSTRNVSGAQTGALSTTNGMFWSWNTGYIMVKAEGTSPNSGSGNFTYHLGGFEGTNNVVTPMSHVFGQTLSITKSSSSTIELAVNPARMFHTFGSVSNGSMIHMPGPDAVTLATDFFTSASFTGIN